MASKASSNVKVARAIVAASLGEPDGNKPSCTLDVDISTFHMKEIARGVLVGLADGGSAAHANRNSKRVALSFERTEYADRSEF